MELADVEDLMNGIWKL